MCHFDGTYILFSIEFKMLGIFLSVLRSTEFEILVPSSLLAEAAAHRRPSK